MKRISLALLMCLLTPLDTLAEQTVAKDLWLKQFKSLAPHAICEAIISNDKTKAFLKDRDISSEKCTPLVTQSLDRCLTQYSNDLPAQVKVEAGKEWGNKMGKCIGEDFYSHYIAKS